MSMANKTDSESMMENAFGEDRGGPMDEITVELPNWNFNLL